MNVGSLDKLKEMVEAEFQRDELRKHAKQQIFQDSRRKLEDVQSLPTIHQCLWRRKRELQTIDAKTECYEDELL
ncbi:hypothetical protein HNY73_013814 [Argiope bruennichi]|uniref:Uncharacterized protein n=1 Tax=Argiope bruennichi TaxID=94029 RepID=A0A8T0ENM4_ARGBR|nr:hypothetical protein HNY73_013814 [Argiope bruennichi]